ncbi:MAG: KilA-N protein [Marmoricola sp.]|nr:KilA-N protein [Marmoricola sp.]
MGNLEISRLNYQGHIIADRGEMLSLTDMWKAAGADSSRQPSNWLASADAKRFIEVLEEVLNPRNSGNELVKVQRGGKTPGTFAHWQIGLAYAKYLSPDFHMWCNEVVRERMEGRVPVGIPDDIVEMLRRDDGMIRMLAHKVTEIEKTMPALVDQMMEARIAADPRVAVVSYVSVKQILENDFKVPAKGRRSIQRKVFIRLSNFCLVNGIKAFKCAHSGTWLFPPHEVSGFVREHCTGLIRHHLDQMKGQGSLRLVS